MDPAVGSKRKLNPSSPEAGVMLSSFVKDGVGDVLRWWCCADSCLTVELQFHVMIMMIAAVTCIQDDYAF